MKQFFKNSALFALLLTGILLLIQIAVSFRIKGKTVTGYDTLELTSNVNADLVFMGSSRCWAHFDPKFFEETYQLKSVNIGMNGHSDLMASRLRLQNYLAQNKAPKFVLLNIDPFISAGSLEHNTKMVNKNDYARFAFFPKEEDQPFMDYFQFDAAERYIPLYALFKYQMFIDCVTLQKSNAFPKGFELNDEQWDTLKYPISDINKKYFFKPKDLPGITQAMKELNDLCQKNNIRLMAIQTPVYQITYDALAFERPKTICQKLDIPFIDANYESIRNKTDYFYNAIHLNKKGVQEMNKRLKNEKELNTILKINP
ncbi:hypothetical protein IVB69_11210 [Flavobacterium sp. J49]|uniref:hypothetical protein n=1 Tax=Flavobacterium sp. J49 TaxID=2718534 RepID=UPI0015945D1E|nr:hypothetical protein [Flavobacterium sp. J49]MBF6642050.1 hypothetical protein [Flavobacterium sp. J49]NIC03298.1 hypothetical protein [Flavobacterium sp. J49]